MSDEKLSGIIVIDKPQNYTSFDVVAVMRGITKQKKVGHTGTLDPLATGVLPILLGSATKAQNLLPDSDKEYIAEFLLGIETDTQDITGRVLNKSKVSVTKAELESVLEKFKGKIKQIPPMYSAVKKDGKRLYDLARSGITVDRPSREVTVKELELISFNEESYKVSIRVYCSKGTYIRTLCSDIGNVLLCGATLTSLRRTMACGFNIDKSITLDQANSYGANLLFDEKLIKTDKLFLNYERVNISLAQTTRFKNGGSLMIERTNLSNKADELFNDQLIRIYSNDDLFLGLAYVDLNDKSLKVKKRF